MRQRVAVAAGGGMAHEEIALALGIARNTLEKHFEHELTIGAYAKRLEVLEALRRAAKRGNVAAARLYMQVEPRSACPPQMPPAKEYGETEKVGKKAQANAEALTAQNGTDWETLLRPTQAPLQ
jgi:hypothetical protein